MAFSDFYWSDMDNIPVYFDSDNGPARYLGTANGVRYKDGVLIIEGKILPLIDEEFDEHAERIKRQQEWRNNE